MHTGEQYHTVILNSKRDCLVRGKFQKMALRLLDNGSNVLDFGAGTGIDAKVYAAHGHPTYVYEPSEAMREYLVHHCRNEISRKTIIPTDSYLAHRVHAVTANFAVLNHIADQDTLFEEWSRVVHRNGFVLISVLNPYYLGDARYSWWRSNLKNLLRNGRYAIPSESRIHRFASRLIAQAASPYFHLELVTPRGLRLTAELYMFLLFRRV